MLNLTVPLHGTPSHAIVSFTGPRQYRSTPGVPPFPQVRVRDEDPLPQVFRVEHSPQVPHSSHTKANVVMVVIVFSVEISKIMKKTFNSDIFEIV